MSSRNAGRDIPPLNYNLRSKGNYRSIVLFFTLIFLEAGVLPLILYFSFKWGAHLSLRKNLAIITSIVGTFSGYKLGMRMWHLWFAKDSRQRRPIGAGRWSVDATQILISVALGAFFAPLIVGSSLYVVAYNERILPPFTAGIFLRSPASVPIVSMALPLFIITICLPLLITGLFAHHIRFPLRLSSLPPHEPLPPATFTLVEDIVAVDGGGRLTFRQAWRDRYEASHVMRKLLRDLAIAWGLSGGVVAGGFLAISWTTTDDIAYGISYGVPWLWAVAASFMTVRRVRKELDREEREWETGIAHREMSLHIRS